MVTLATSPSKTLYGDESGWLPWLEALPAGYSPDDLTLIRSACEFAEPLYADRLFLDDPTLMQHALGTAGIVANLPLDAGAVAAAVLHAVPDCLEDAGEALVKHFGKDMALVVHHPLGDLLEASGQPVGLGAAMRFHHADDDIGAFQLALARLRQHFIGLADARREAEEYLEPAAPFRGGVGQQSFR